MKIIVINKEEGQFAIPLEIVAKNYADHYAEADGFAKDSEDYQNEINLVMNDDFQGIDWLLNNMDWIDVKFAALQLNAKKMMQEKFWTCSDDFEISKANGTEFPFSIWKITRKDHRDKFLERCRVDLGNG